MFVEESSVESFEFIEQHDTARQKSSKDLEPWDAFIHVLNHLVMLNRKQNSSSNTG